MMGTQCLHEARLLCLIGVASEPDVDHVCNIQTDESAFLERHYRLNCAIKKQSSNQRESAARLTGPLGSFLHGPKTYHRRVAVEQD